MKTRTLSIMDSFHPTGSVKNLLHCITNVHEQAKRRTSVFLEHALGRDTLGTSSSRSSQNSDCCTLSGFETIPGYEMDMETPLWRCRGEEETPLESPLGEAPKLLDSQVFVFWPEDFDFACAGEDHGARGTPRQNANKFSRSMRRWSSPHTLGLPSQGRHPKASIPAVLPQTQKIRREAVEDIPKRRPAPTHLDLPPLKLTIKAHGVQSYCASNKWGNQPPAGYI